MGAAAGDARDIGLDLAGAQIELDQLAELGVVGKQMHVDLVCAQLGAALADLGEVERGRAVATRPIDSASARPLALRRTST